MKKNAYKKWRKSKEHMDGEECKHLKNKVKKEGAKEKKNREYEEWRKSLNTTERRNKIFRRHKDEGQGQPLEPGE